MKKIKKALALVLALAMIATVVPVASTEAASTAKLSATTATIAVGSKKVITLTTPSTWKKVKTSWKVGKKSVAQIVAVTKKASVRAQAAGETNVKVKVTYAKSNKKGAKRYSKSLYCKVTVKEAFGIKDLQAKTASTLVATLADKVSSEAKVEVTKAGITTPVAGEVKIDGTTVTFSTTANLSTGTYTMTVTDGDKSASKTVEVQNEFVKEIVITSTQALTDPANKKKAYIYYDVKNQYGESVRQSTSIEWSSSAKSITAEKATGKLTVTSDNDFVYGNQIYVTGVYTKTGISVNKAVTVGMEQALNSVETVGFVNKNKPTVKLDSLPSDFAKDTYYMIYETKDQDGNPLDAANDNIAQSRVTFISDNILLVKIDDKDEKVFTIDGAEYSAVAVEPGQYVDKGGEVNITAISNKTGAKSIKNYVVGGGVLLNSLVITGPTGIVADGQQGVKLAYAAKDTAGNNITNYESIVRSTNTLSLSVSEGTLKVKEENDGTAGIYWSDKSVDWDDPVTADDVDRTVALTTVVVGGESNNYLLNVSDKRRPVAIKEIKSVNGGANALVANASATIDFSKDSDVVYLDQYGADMTATAAEAFFDYSYDHGFGKGTAYAYGVKADFTATNKLGNVDTLCKKNSYTLTLDGADVDTVVNDTVKFSIAQIKFADRGNDVGDWDVAGKVKSLTFDVVPVDTLTGIGFASVGKQKLETGKEGFANGAEAELDVTKKIDTVTSINDGAGFGVKITGKYNGKDLDIPSAYYTIDDNNVSVTGNTITAVKENQLKWSDLYDSNTARLTRKDATITISADVFNKTTKAADKKNSTVKLSVKLSDEARRATTIVIKEGKAATKNADTTNKAFNAWFTENSSSAGNGVYVLDQYGKEFNDASFTYTVSDIKEAATEFTHLSDSIKVSANGTNAASVTKAELGDTFNLTIAGTAGGSTVSDSIAITIGADVKANMTHATNDDKADLRPVLGYDR